MDYDPWDWSKKQTQQDKINGPLGNTIAPLQASTEQAPPPVNVPVTPEKPNELLQTAKGIAVAKGADKATNYVGKEYDAWKASQPLEPTYTMAEGPVSSAPLSAEATTAAAPESMMPAGVDMSGATTAGYTAPVAETAAVSAAPLAAPASAAVAPASSVAGTYGVGTATTAATTGAATAGAGAAGGAAAGGAAGSAGLTAALASNPIGWGVGALLLAKSMNWI